MSFATIQPWSNVAQNYCVLFGPQIVPSLQPAEEYDKELVPPVAVATGEDRPVALLGGAVDHSASEQHDGGAGERFHFKGSHNVDVKYRMMKSVADNSKKKGANAKFAVGQIVAEMKARFKHMVQIYATFAKYNDMAINNEYTDLYYWVEKPNRDVKNYIYAFMMIESDYNEIMNFNEMFFDALSLKKKEAKIQLQSDLLELNRTLDLSKISHEKTSIATEQTSKSTVTKGTITTTKTTETKPTQAEEETTTELQNLRTGGIPQKRLKYPRDRQRRSRPNNREAMKKFAK